MAFAITLVITALAVFVLEPAIRRFPTAFYVVAIVVDLVFMAQAVGLIAMPRAVWLVFFALIQKCILPLALFTVVMAIGCFSKNSPVRLRLQPIRGELSIMAWFLALGHMAVYLESYLPRIVSGTQLNGNVLLAFLVAFVLFILLMVLGITSFKFVKKNMKASSWVKLQKLAYPFFGLAYVHVLLVLLPSALRGGASACESATIYTVVFVAYLVARLLRARADKRVESAEE